MPLLSRYADLNPTAPLPEGQVWAVMIRPIATTNTEEAGVEFYKLPVSLSHHAWTSQRDFQESWLSVAIGAVAASTSIPNPAIARALFFSTTQDENFGTCSEGTLATWNGDVVAIRADGKEVVEEHVKALLAYLSHTIYPLLEPLPQLRSPSSRRRC